MTLMRPALLAIVMFWTLPAHSAQPDCEGQSQLDLTQCAAEKAQAATKDMKAAYNNVYGALESEDRPGLFRSQVAWIQYMRAWCNALNSPFKDGSIYPMLVASCQENLTRRRELDLKAYFDSP